MSNEFGHATVGTSMTQAEFEAVGLHVCDSQATGDLLYASSGSQLSRLGIGATNAVLHVAGGIPAWSSTLAGLTLTSPTINGTIATTGLTLPAITLGGAVTGGNQSINNLNNIGIYNDASDANTGIYGIITQVEPAANKQGLAINLYGRQTSAATARVLTGIYFTVGTDGSNTQNWTAAPGFRTILAGLAFSGSGTISLATQMDVTTTISGGTLSNWRGIWFRDPTGAGTLTNAYAIYIDAITKGATLNWGIYNLSPSYLVGITLGGALQAKGQFITWDTSLDSAAVADQVSLSGYEIAVGARALAISQEDPVITEAVGASDRTLRVRINGTTYKIMLVAV